VRDPATGHVYVVAEARLAEIPGAVPKTKKSAGKKDAGGKKGAGKKDAAKEAGAAGKGDAGKDGAVGEAEPAGFEVLARMAGSDLVGLTYEPLFPYYAALKQQGAFRCAWGEGGGRQGGRA
jgi:isoleucyl-tRNA synthetase